MSGFYTGLSATAIGLLADKGQTMTLSRKVAGAYDPATGAAAETTTTFAVSGAVFDYPDRKIDGALIQSGDRKVLLDSAVEPAVNDSLLIGGVAHTVLTVKKTAPAGIVVLYTLQVRAGG